METNHEYKGFLGCFPDIIGAHKVCEEPFLLRVGSGKIHSIRSGGMVHCICAAAWPLLPETPKVSMKTGMLIFKTKNT